MFFFPCSFSSLCSLVSHRSPPPHWLVKQSALCGRSALAFSALACFVLRCVGHPGNNPPARSSRALCGIRPGHSDVGRGSPAASHPHTALSDRARRAFFMRLLQCGASGDIVVLECGVSGTAVTVFVHVPFLRCSTRCSKCWGCKRTDVGCIGTARSMMGLQRCNMG